MAKMSFEAGSLKRGSRLKRWLIILLIILLASLLVINSFTISEFQIVPLGNNSNQGNYNEVKPPVLLSASTHIVKNGYVVDTKGCRIPDLSPFEPSVMRFIDKAKPIVCEQGTHLPLISSNNSAIFVNLEARSHYYAENESINCCWRNFWRSDFEDNKVEVSKDCHSFKEAAFTNEEFVKVECQLTDDSVYVDYFAFVPRKLQVESRCRAVARDALANYVLPPDEPAPRKPSVLIVGVDSVSRLNLHRSMPKTIELMRRLGAVELLGYNKVADNTYPNLVPLLTGMSEAEFEKFCWTDHAKPFDDCPLIWKQFRDNGYRTVFAEDACYMTIFNYLKPGFRNQPTDYYLRPYCVAAESEIGNTHKGNAKLCLGTRLNFETLLEYTRKVVDEFAADPYFALFWQASLTHDYIEFPQLGDSAYHEFFAHAASEDLLRDTVVLFMSDHGMRWGSFRQTYQGRLEDSLPFFFLLLPDWWKRQHPDAWNTLVHNSNSLTTPFDIHQTLNDILHPSRIQLDAPKVKAKTKGVNGTEAVARGISLFSRIPDERTCESAGIPEHWCMCHSRRNVSRDEPALGQVGPALVRQLNELLDGRTQCARLELDELLDAKALGDGSDKNAPWTEYTLTFRTRPGAAVFEGSVRFRPDDNSTSLVGSVSRLNAYGDQSACVDDFHLRLYCYCLPPS